MHLQILFLTLLTTLHLTKSQTTTSNNGTTIQTQQGPITGTLLITPDAQPRVRQFLGIPYASAKRWQAPQLPPKRSSTSPPLDASGFGPSCPQSLTPVINEFLSLTGSGGQESSQESEECLSVNVWAPSVDRPQSTAVMIWIYGGSFTYGTVRNKNDQLTYIHTHLHLLYFSD